MKQVTIEIIVCATVIIEEARAKWEEVMRQSWFETSLRKHHYQGPISKTKLTMLAHVYNPSYARCEDRRIMAQEGPG
jgi:hypothetical protein